MDPNSPFDLLRGYAGASPGQNLTALLQCLTIGDLQLIVGTSVLPLLPRHSASEKETLLLAAENAFRNNPATVFADTEKRRTLLRNLIAAKQDELRHRLNEAGCPVEPSGADIPALAGPHLQAVACKFLGIPIEESVEGAVRHPPRYAAFKPPSSPNLPHSSSHAQDIASALAAHGIRSAVVSGETSLAKRAAVVRNFKSGTPDPQVLCNFGVLTTGFDAPKTSAAVIARPTKSLVLYSQMVGRATRGARAGGNETCEIMTVHDPDYPGFGSIGEAFFNWEDVWNHD